MVDVLFLIGIFGFFGFAMLVAWACARLMEEKA
jgi:hypothetical protein